MDVFYEESSIVKNSTQASKKYKIMNIIANVFLTLVVVGILFGISFIPLGAWILWGFILVWLFCMWFMFFKLKSRFNVNYDYSFVSGELRIAKVFNINKRKLLARIDSEDIIQLGDVENTSFDGLRADPNTKLVLCTSNDEAAEGKFFMYVLANVNGKKLYVLECREELLMHMMRFVKRTVLESDYVMQEKKKNRV